MKFKITWNGQGGELDSVTAEGDEYGGAITNALIELVKGTIITPGDSFIVEEVE
jgi:hypothetical protein